MNELAGAINRHLEADTTMQTVLPNTHLFRVRDVQPLTPIVYNPCIYFVAQGEKEAWLEGQRYVYNQDQYLVLTVPLPLRCRVFNAKPGEPFLAVRLDIDLPVLNELLTQLPEGEQNTDVSKTGIFITETNSVLQDSMLRLINTLDNPDQKNVLSPIYYREILFHLLQGPQARLLRDFATTDRQNNRISLAINHIHKNFKQSLRVEELADIAAMSPSTFHAHFKTVTRHSPLQYIKNVRLHHAKHQIFIDRLPVSDAAFNAGYESASQFSREYKRLFGLSPANHLKEAG